MYSSEGINIYKRRKKWFTTGKCHEHVKQKKIFLYRLFTVAGEFKRIRKKSLKLQRQILQSWIYRKVSPLIQIPHDFKCHFLWLNQAIFKRNTGQRNFIASSSIGIYCQKTTEIIVKCHSIKNSCLKSLPVCLKI